MPVRFVLGICMIEMDKNCITIHFTHYLLSLLGNLKKTCQKKRQICGSNIVMPPTSKLEGHIASGVFVCSSVLLLVSLFGA